MAALEMLELGVQQYLRELSDAEFNRLVAITRPPTANWPNEAPMLAHKFCKAEEATNDA